MCYRKEPLGAKIESINAQMLVMNAAATTEPSVMECSSATMQCDDYVALFATDVRRNAKLL